MGVEWRGGGSCRDSGTFRVSTATNRRSWIGLDCAWRTLAMKVVVGSLDDRATDANHSQVRTGGRDRPSYVGPRGVGSLGSHGKDHDEKKNMLS